MHENNLTLIFANRIVLFFMQKKVMEIREQLRRTAQRIGIALKSCDTDMQVICLHIYLTVKLKMIFASP